MSFDMNSPNPYAPSTQPAAPKKSNVLLYVLLGVGGVLLLGCCGCAGFSYFAFNAGTKQIATSVRPQLQADPAIQQHIGNLNSVEVDIGAVMTEVQKNPQRHQGRNMAVRVKGDKGEGVVLGRFDQTAPGEGRMANAELILPNGDMHSISP